LVAVALASISANAQQSVARIWDEQILSAIRIDRPNPPVHARNLFSLSVAMWDAWAAYDPVAKGYVYTNKHTAANIAAARREAISYASYRLLRSRFANSVGVIQTMEALDAQFAELGYDPSVETVDPSTPAGLGNLIFQQVHEFFINDGSRQAQGYADLPPEQGGYTPTNTFTLLIGTPGSLATNINRWQPLAITDALTQNGIPADSIQKFVGANWWNVRSFSLTRPFPRMPWIDVGLPPQLGLDPEQDEAFRSNVVAVIRASSTLTPDDETRMDISPAAFGDNPLGENSGRGHPINPATGQPYESHSVKVGDFGRVLTEYWADGPHSETPPGHWNVIANEVRDHPEFRARFRGVGPELDPLEWDVKMYFALNAAVHDAACAAWTIKRYYDGWRPMSAVRYMAMLGQCTLTNDPSYHPHGLPLIPGLIELSTEETAVPGGRHDGVPAGLIALRAWPGQVRDPLVSYAGVHWVRGDMWWPYNTKTFVTPAFPGFVSGHSTFSRAAAEVLTEITGSRFFPGGMGGWDAPANERLIFEVGPSETIQLQWATYYDAADYAGIARIYGGIHPPADDFGGRIVGSQAGKLAWNKALTFFAPEQVANISATIRDAGNNSLSFTFDSSPGFYYRLQHSATLGGEFANTAGAAVSGTGQPLTITHPAEGASGFFRVRRSTSP
jgi:hypothetical protein